eukprot:Rmarinus@m.6302
MKKRKLPSSFALNDQVSSSAPEKPIRSTRPLPKRAHTDPLLELRQVCDDAQGRDIVVDVETTGFSADDEILEIGAVELKGGIETGNLFHTMLEATRSSHPMAASVHGIDFESAAYAKLPQDEALKNFREFVGGARLVGHQISFDLRMLNNSMIRAGMKPFKEENTYCTMRVFRSHFPHYPTWTLDTACDKLGISRRDRSLAGLHGALIDARLTARVFRALLALGSPRPPRVFVPPTEGPTLSRASQTNTTTDTEGITLSSASQHHTTGNTPTEDPTLSVASQLNATDVAPAAATRLVSSAITQPISSAISTSKATILLGSYTTASTSDTMQTTVLLGTSPYQAPPSPPPTTPRPLPPPRPLQ